MFCSKCGAKNIEDAKFCQECGSHLNSPSEKINRKDGLIMSVNGQCSELQLYDYYLRIKVLGSKSCEYLLSDIISTEIRPPHGLRRYPKLKFHLRGIDVTPQTGGLLTIGGNGPNFGLYGGGGAKPVTSALFKKEQEPEFLKFKELIDLKLSEIHNK